jgi:quinoprotein dehydrogenase-associated probable ABC transporter substrate-binding protein
MSLRFLKPMLVLLLLPAMHAQPKSVLKVCADPNNLPFSNAKGQGFENALARLIAKDLGMKLKFYHSRFGRGFVRNVMNEGACEVLMGVPSGFRQLLTTSPYYRASYVFVTKSGSGLHPSSFGDPVLRGRKIGVQIADDEYAPPALLLARQGSGATVVGFDTVEDSDSILQALQRGTIDGAIVWGPLAGSYRCRDRSLALSRMVNQGKTEFPMSFDISIGLRKSDAALRDRIERVLQRRRVEIAKILSEAGVVTDKEGD